jgi:hypothetical protein
VQSEPTTVALFTGIVTDIDTRKDTVQADVTVARGRSQ